MASQLNDKAESEMKLSVSSQAHKPTQSLPAPCQLPPGSRAGTHLSIEVDEVKGVQTHLHLDLRGIHLLGWGRMEGRAWGIERGLAG